LWERGELDMEQMWDKPKEMRKWIDGYGTEAGLEMILM
jgi:hypothetical protein